MELKAYEKLVAWQEAFSLCLWIYKITKNFPTDEKIGIISQMRRSAQSVPMNIAEGNAKRSLKDRARYFEIGIASLDELHCQCRISLGLEYINQETFDKANDHIHRVSYLLNKLRSAIL